MEWMGVNDIRESFLSYFESKGHKRLPSFPLLPKDDKSLLLINSGMAPMKKWFLGQVLQCLCSCYLIIIYLMAPKSQSSKAYNSDMPEKLQSASSK